MHHIRSWHDIATSDNLLFPIWDNKHGDEDGRYRNKENLLAEVVRLGLDKEISPDGTYYAYFPFGLMIERPRMAAYRNKEKICCEKGCRCGLDMRKPRMAVLVVLLIRGFD